MQTGIIWGITWINLSPFTANIILFDLTVFLVTNKNYEAPGYAVFSDLLFPSLPLIIKLPHSMLFATK
jgi:hypothetical protein